MKNKILYYFVRLQQFELKYLTTLLCKISRLPRFYKLHSAHKSVVPAPINCGVSVMFVRTHCADLNSQRLPLTRMNTGVVGIVFAYVLVEPTRRLRFFLLVTNCLHIFGTVMLMHNGHRNLSGPIGWRHCT